MQNENQLTIQVAQYLDLLKTQGKIIIFSHVAHEGKVTPWKGVQLKRMGKRKGVPDFVIVFKSMVLFLELKRERGGVVSPEQKEWIQALKKIGGTVFVMVAKGFDQAKQTIDLFI